MGAKESRIGFLSYDEAVKRVRVSTMVRSKELSEALRKKIVAAYESGKGFKKISKEFDISHSTIQKTVYKWRTFNTTATMPRSARPSKFIPRADRKMLKEVIKSPKISSRDLQQALATVDVKVHDSTIRQRLHKFDFPLLSKKNIKARLKFARENIDKRPGLLE
ncbi:hypothetical protein L3Q82_019161 [Scortum barcoo]|uniref:Uncharacterized protein n=1 Tax=Scortum barcoo TaxID=214431 RepID=A0ACB8VG62_9TELE|nr:hypothetical protein L3Q82_019161 [Scortum barcoo]